jgi:hypothetical protein
MKNKRYNNEEYKDDGSPSRRSMTEDTEFEFGSDLEDEMFEDA